MKTWFALDLGDGVLAGSLCDDIEQKFQQQFIAAGRPAARAVFKRHDNESSIHCTVTAYFSPATADLANALHATPCPRPARRGLELLAGTQDAWSALFPES
jgi:hypothetical protein